MHLLDAWHAVECGGALVEEGGTEKCDRAVLRGIGFDGAGEFLPAVDRDVHGPRGEGDQVLSEGFSDAFQHVGADVLFAGLDAGNGTLGGVDPLGEGGLGKAERFADVSDAGSDVLHMTHSIAYMLCTTSVV